MCQCSVIIRTWWKLCYWNIGIRSSYMFFLLDVMRVSLLLRKSRHVVLSSGLVLIQSWTRCGIREFVVLWFESIRIIVNTEVLLKYCQLMTQSILWIKITEPCLYFACLLCIVFYADMFLIFTDVASRNCALKCLIYTLRKDTVYTSVRVIFFDVVSYAPATWYVSTIYN